MLMSKSRLEKFLYALYSLDSSDLPTPLSRIEELYNCLVTGDEAPTFEPLSRVEKYLMAILGVYDVNELPNPISRVEVLLYKLAIGDDNLDDIKSFLSEHEELLAEIIRNGGAGGNINIEYVLYTLSTEFNTLYNTAKKPVKSAILKGQTSFDVLNYEFLTGKYINLNDGTFIDGSSTHIYHEDYVAIPKGTQVITLKGNNNFKKICYYDNNKQFIIAHHLQTKYTDDFTTDVPTGASYFRFNTSQTIASGSTITLDEYLHVYLDGFLYMTNKQGYTVGARLISCKMPVLCATGKNLFDKTVFTRVDDKWIDENGSEMSETILGYSKNLYYIGMGTFTISGTIGNNIRLFFYDKQGVFKGRSPLFTNTLTFSCDEETYVRIGYRTTTLNVDNIQIEQGTQSTFYEPYKTNILTVNEEVELHEIGDIKDELNLLTGEVVKRVGKVVLDGSIDEAWTTITNSNAPAAYVEGYASAYINLSDFRVGTSVKLINDRGLPRLSSVSSNSEGLFYLNNYIGNRALILRIDKSKVTNSLREYLQHNPITIQYQLATESVKTVDLSVVDQDGNSTKLKTFDDITYVTLSSKGLIPEAELEVATKNEEVLNSMSLEMDDIFTTQTTLGETVNTQSENVDATMIATTEIYEELL